MPVSDKLTPESVASALQESLAALSEITDAASLRGQKAQIIGENSALSQLNGLIKSVPNEQKAEAGKLVGGARAQLSAAFAEKEAELEALERNQALAAEAVDLSAAPKYLGLGARHPLSLLMDQIGDVFVGMGWEIADGPELENEWFNFDALNFHPDHPARAMQDTFFVKPVENHLLLRTHTSPVQVRSLLERELPVYVLCPGRVFRTDELDATHTPVFHQVEGLAIDKGLTMADLRGTLEHFARVMFGQEAKIRLRPSFFPFTEPSAELDVWHPDAKGGPRWVEWGGCGMVNPNVLLAAGIDPEVYSGFAFGMGIERTLMFRNGVLDMHDMVEADVRFSAQFGSVI
ncbi:MAG: phenylalanine--tRNA ligase subunit alpha [Micrococcales bacterium]|nr:phenylalanine--tRNA ligase subunit alpha [Micrococcales bacterium]MBT5397769.1 phenylalanine--tRNA ligase subunit alpha [Micrococcales bacterium]MBT5431899.1 phenylalanine--tRNA ligase subunit alpha [Micrococcales bacterium]MBT5848381.1 phenylalanine--tRNA ligase subunit alpha [Micrococcales bacterium]MBT7926449.1 phenylalanine--tRNA ligase subunit alpha [Micrococcales bacterium]